MSFRREYFQEIYYTIDNLPKNRGKGEVSWIIWLRKWSRGFEFFKLLLASDIFSIALLFATFFFRRTAIFSCMQKYVINVL